MLRTNNMSTVYHKTPSILQIASPTHCESIGSELRQNVIKANLNCHLMGQHRELSVGHNDEVDCLQSRATLVTLVYIKSERAVATTLKREIQ
jgi:hypothetical protein